MTSVLKKTFLTALAMGAMGVAQAATFRIDFSGNNYNYTFGAPVPDRFEASIIITTAGDASSFENVLSVSGTINGETITGIETNTPNASNPTYAENTFYASAPYLTAQGVWFKSDTAVWAIYNPRYYEGTAVFTISNRNKFWVVSPDKNGFSTVTALSTPTVPEPETYALFVAGLAVAGAVARRRKR